MPNAFTSMMSKSEESRITAFAQTVTEPNCVVEIGCWVGESTKAILRGFGGELHLIDTFVWTSDHNEKYPDTLNVGGDFSPITRENLRGFERPGGIHIHEGSAEDFDTAVLGPDPVGLLLLDGPKSARVVQQLILKFIPHMAPSSRILIKHVASARLTDLLDVMVRLVEAEVLTSVGEFPAEGSDTLLAFAPHQQPASVSSALMSSTWLDIFDAQFQPMLERCAMGQLLPVIWLLRGNHREAALKRAGEIPYSPTLLKAWVGLQDFLLNKEGMDLETLIEVEMLLAS
jgi:hypothetical protein